MDIYFSDFFKVDPEDLESYGAFNISLVTDLPLFVDPFLLFNSSNKQYQELHEEIIRYLKFLKDNATAEELEVGKAKALYCFPEVSETWLGFSKDGNGGHGLGMDFARALHANLFKIFTNFGDETVTKSSHLERLCLIRSGVGRDNISDFTLNLIKGFLAEYTEKFAREFIDASKCTEVSIDRAKFNYETGTWERKVYLLPKHNDEYVILVPKDMLTKDDTWINRSDLIKDFDRIPDALPDEALRYQINHYFGSVLTSKDPTKKEKEEAANKTLIEFPQLIDYYIKFKEDTGSEAVKISDEKVRESQEIYVAASKSLSDLLAREGYYELPQPSAHSEALKRAKYFKECIEKKDGWTLFYDANGKPILRRERDAQVMFRLTWFGTVLDVNREPNNGRGPVDYAVSEGAKNKSLIEFKLGKSTSLKKNLQNQVEIYKQANETTYAVTVILIFSDNDKSRVDGILKQLGLQDCGDIVIVDARSTNKQSASKAKSH